MSKHKKTVWRTSQEDFEFFIERCKYYIQAFGMHHWWVSYAHAPIEDGLAQCNIRGGGQYIATLQLDPAWNGPVTKALIDRCAFHEVLHMWFYDMWCVAMSPAAPAVREELWGPEEHKLIRALENLFLPAISAMQTSEDIILP